jgi:hypothetical protein
MNILFILEHDARVIIKGDLEWVQDQEPKRLFKYYWDKFMKGILITRKGRPLLIVYVLFSVHSLETF